MESGSLLLLCGIDCLALVGFAQQVDAGVVNCAEFMFASDYLVT